MFHFVFPLSYEVKCIHLLFSILHVVLHEFYAKRSQTKYMYFSLSGLTSAQVLAMSLTLSPQVIASPVVVTTMVALVIVILML